jgi:hypothetical protein
MRVSTGKVVRQDYVRSVGRLLGAYWEIEVVLKKAALNNCWRITMDDKKPDRANYKTDKEYEAKLEAYEERAPVRRFLRKREARKKGEQAQWLGSFIHAPGKPCGSSYGTEGATADEVNCNKCRKKTS